MRKYAYSSIMFLNHYITGLLVPVQSLIFIEKGLSMAEIALIFGIYSFTVLVLEIPSGIASDMIGRKNTFVSSLIVSAASFALIACGNGLIAMSAGMMIYGASRALSSGSFDALFIDWHNDTYGEAHLYSASLTLSVCESLGLSLGSLTGGLLPSLGLRFFHSSNPYMLNIAARCVIAVLLSAFVLTYVKEVRPFASPEKASLQQHLSECRKIVAGKKKLTFVFTSIFATGFFLFTMETYWQPYFKGILNNDSLTWLFGVLSFLYFAASMAGAMLSGRLLGKIHMSAVIAYVAMRLVFIAAIAVMSLQSSVPKFMLMYTATYLCLGLTNIPESIILNSEVPSQSRASMLSLGSMILQIGCLTASCTCALIAGYVSIPHIWLLSAFIMFITLTIGSCVLIKHRRCHPSKQAHSNR